MTVDKSHLLESLFRYNYFPIQSDRRHELPPIYNSEKFNSNIGKIIKNLPLSVNRKKIAFDHVTYKLTRHPNIPRIVNIPHPKPYSELCFHIYDFWDQEISHRIDSKNSAIKPRYNQKDNRVIKMKYGEVTDITDHELRSRFGKKFFVRTDIANFFHSVYTHSIPWAAVGHSIAKQQQSNSLWYNALDKYIRFCKRNETVGIAIGPATSNIASEIILSKIDENLRNTGYVFYRFVDDYKVYCNTYEQAEKFVIDLSGQLEFFSLKLNIKKTHIEELPKPVSDAWLLNLKPYIPESKEIDVHQTINFIEKAISLNDETPDGSILKYALTTLLYRVKGIDAAELLDRYLFDLSFYYPSLVPLINRWMNKHVELYYRYAPRLERLALENLAKNRSDAVVWVLYYFQKIKVMPSLELLNRAFESKDCIVVLAAYQHTRKFGYIPAFIGDILLTKNVYDIDQYWLLFYQLYLDGAIDLPYVDQEDNKVFETLKNNKVSFVSEDHDDLKSQQKYFEKIFAKLKISLKSSLKGKNGGP